MRDLTRTAQHAHGSLKHAISIDAKIVPLGGKSLLRMAPNLAESQHVVGDMIHSRSFKANGIAEVAD
jgi:hypothetical protein